METLILFSITALFSVSLYYSWIFTLMAIYALLTISWLFSRKIGRISMGHSMIFGLPAYLSSMGYVFSAELSAQLFIAGILINTALYYLFSEYTGRTAFVFLTLIFSIFLWLLFPKITVHQDEYILGGEVGFAFLNLDQKIMHTIAGVMLVTFYITLRLIERSKLGYMMTSVGDDETASKAVGINVRHVKIITIFLSSVSGGIAGLLYVLEFGHVSPQIFSVEVSIFPFIATLISAGNPFISVIVSFVLVYMTRVLNSIYPGLMGIFYAFMLILSPKIGRWIYAKGKRLVEEDR